MLPPSRPSPPRRRLAALAALADDDAKQRAPASGRLVEAVRGGRTSVLLLTEADSKKKWVALTPDGARTTVKASDVTAVLPGDGHDKAALDKATAAAAAAVADDGGLLQDAWEMSSAPASPASSSTGTLSLADLTDLLYGEADDPAAAAAALALASSPDGRTLFKRVGRTPAPAWEARPERDVVSLRGAEAAKAAAAAAVDAAVAAFKTAADAPAAAKPTPEAWQAGSHATFIEALDALALEQADGGAASAAVPLLRTLRRPPTSDGAAALLSAVGVRPPHELPSLRRAGLTPDFVAEVERAAAWLAASPPDDPDASRRLDVSSTHTVFTVDDASTTEIDDGLSVERDDDGKAVALWVHVADPSRWLPPPPSPTTAPSLWPRATPSLICCVKPPAASAVCTCRPAPSPCSRACCLTAPSPCAPPRPRPRCRCG